MLETELSKSTVACLASLACAVHTEIQPHSGIVVEGRVIIFRTASLALA